MQAELTMSQLRASVITRTADAYRTATTVDVTESMHQQLILMVEWAKQMEQFRRLPMQSQIGLLRHFSAQHLVICAAYRSIGAKEIMLNNYSCLPRDAPKIPVSHHGAAVDPSFYFMCVKSVGCKPSSCQNPRPFDETDGQVAHRRKGICRFKSCRIL